jgi:hypothetical protein
MPITRGAGNSHPTCKCPTSPLPRQPPRQQCSPLLLTTQLPRFAGTTSADFGSARVPGRLRGARPRPHLRQPPRRFLARPPQTPCRSNSRRRRRRKHRRGRLQQPASPPCLASHVLVLGRRAGRPASRPGAPVLRAVAPPVGRPLLRLTAAGASRRLHDPMIKGLPGASPCPPPRQSGTAIFNCAQGK